jgi:hypothetical protein
MPQSEAPSGTLIVQARPADDPDAAERAARDRLVDLQGGHIEHLAEDQWPCFADQIFWQKRELPFLGAEADLFVFQRRDDRERDGAARSFHVTGELILPWNKRNLSDKASPSKYWYTYGRSACERRTYPESL